MTLKGPPAPWAAGKAKEKGINQGQVLLAPDAVFLYGTYPFVLYYCMA